MLPCPACGGEDPTQCDICDDDGQVQVPTGPTHWYIGRNPQMGRTHLLGSFGPTFSDSTFCGLRGIPPERFVPGDEERPIVDCPQCNRVTVEDALIDELGSRLAWRDLLQARIEREAADARSA
jgi:hypothetical protein